MDNRILNNLRQQVNEMIEDSRGLFPLDTFKGMWFTYFKGETEAANIYEKILPFICVVEDKNGNLISVESLKTDPLIEKCIVSAERFMKFIDMFNYFPVQVNKLRHKNDSNHLTMVLTSNTKASLDSKTVGPKGIKKDPEEAHLLKLLSMVSHRLYERF
jgi:hypothetical protein